MLKITNVSKYKGLTYMVEFEGADTEFINKAIVDMFSLRSGMTIPESAWEQVREEEEYRKARERALYLLDFKDYSYVDLFHKLEKNYSEDVCYRVMDKMVEMGTINDRRYAEGLARHYVEVKKFGKYRALREMRGKGLTSQVAEEALEMYDDSYYERLYELVESKYLRYLDDEKGVNKVKNALVRYGYSYGLIKEVLRDIEDEYGEE